VGEEAGPVQRARGVVGRAKAAPSRVEWLYANQEAVNEALRSTLERLDAVSARLDQLDARLAQVPAGGSLEARIDALDGAVAGHAQVLQRVVTSARADAELDRLRQALGPAAELRPGLSVFIICWNHADLLPTAMASALQILDRLDPEHAGELLVLDDASSDATGAVADGWAARDPRVRVVHAEANLGLGRARNVLLHAAGTTHAFQLDADNTAEPAGVATVYEVARRYDATFTYGTVVRVDPEGRGLGVMSNEPLSEPWLRSNYIDTMAVVDVAELRRLRGWPQDPAFDHIDDYALVHRIAKAGGLIGFVPVIGGRYVVTSEPFHRTVADPRLGPARVVRTFDPAGLLHPAGIAAFAAHPDLGPLWATPAAVAARTELAVPEAADAGPADDAEPAGSGARLLVVASGGVDNLGDDAITAAVLEHLDGRGDDVVVDVVTDGDRPIGLPPSVEWLGTLSEIVWGLDVAELEDDDGIRAAASRASLGHVARRPLEPSSYRAVLFLGGGSLTSLWGDGLVAPRSVLASALRVAGVPYVAGGQGIGPLDEDDLALVRQFAAGARRMSTRDRASAELVAPHATPVGDDAVVLRPAPAAAIPDRPFVVLSLRAADYVGAGTTDIERWADAVDAYAAGEGLTVLCLPFNDQPAAPEVDTLLRLARAPRAARWEVRDYDPDPRRVLAVLRAAEATVTHSYHAALLTLASGVPAVIGAATPYYEAKADGMRELLGLPPETVVWGDEPLDLPGRVAAVRAALDPAHLEELRASVTRWWWQAVDDLLAEPAPRVSG
jgi:polysaccharide pyruvyl transferase WcaK-like protein